MQRSLLNGKSEEEFPTHFRIKSDDEYTLKTLVNDNTELASQLLGSEVIGCSDEIFAEASNLIKPNPPVKAVGRFTEIGAWYDGWETKRHNPQPCDWAVISLAFPGFVSGFDIDNTHFSIGNSAPEASVEGCYFESLLEDDCEVPEELWSDLLPKVKLQPDQNNFFMLKGEAKTKKVNFIRLKMYPDGGISRLRVYGKVVPNLPPPDTQIDLAFVGNGGRITSCSNQHFSKPSNLLLPGRGTDMSDGWETARSRGKLSSDWVVVALGLKGRLEKIEVDTKNFIGNYPQSIEVEGCFTRFDDPKYDQNVEWLKLVPMSKATANQNHPFRCLESDTVFSHIRLTIYPDGGVKRLRALGRVTASDNPGVAEGPVVQNVEVSMTSVTTNDEDGSVSTITVSQTRIRTFDEALGEDSSDALPEAKK